MALDAPSGMAYVPAGSYAPLFPIKGEVATPVAAFWLDERAVTNAEYLEFVRAQPRWRRSLAPHLFVDEHYLSHWSGDLELGATAGPEQPVTFVSWFAASAYCREQAKRLPSEAEWELAANPPGASPEAEAESARQILAFYARPRGVLPRAGATAPNAYGLRDLHGVIWEWVSDWNASLVLSDSRSDRDRADQAFCGGAAAAASDPERYATFMRFAFRSSLEATYGLHHLGFRSARSVS
jgi:formylglycine-generating enzyme required for sulfatase activity